MPIFRERRTRRMTEAEYNARVRQALIGVVAELFGDGASPGQAARDAAEQRLRRLLRDKQLNLLERSQLEGQVWQHFANGSPERTWLNAIGFLSWN
jgi:hypothetical protein